MRPITIMVIQLATPMPRTELKALGDVPKIRLLGGVDLQAFVDVAGGPPTDGQLTMNLLVQLSPLLASLTCVFKMLDVLVSVEEFATSAKDLPDPTKIVTAADKLVAAIGELKAFVPPLQVAQLASMLKSMLELVLRFLAFFLEQAQRLLEFRASIDLSSADGNVALTEALTRARNGADAAEANLLKSLGPLQPIMKIVGMVAGVAGVPLTIPDFAAPAADAAAAVASVKQAVDSLKGVVDSIPG